MKDKLIEYGFDNLQVETLITKGKLQTVHGAYVLNGNKLTLKKADGTVKKVEI